MLVICALLVNNHVKVRIGRRVVDVNYLKLIDDLVGIADVAGLVEIDGRTKAQRCRNTRSETTMDSRGASSTFDAQARRSSRSRLVRTSLIVIVAMI
jgi:hypothetical protein